MPSSLACIKSDYFYPRPPRGGRRNNRCCRRRLSRFLSPPSARRATSFTHGSASFRIDFYPRPPRGGRPTLSKIQHCGSCISIPALREEGDRGAALIGCTRHLFLSPPSARRATLSSSVSLCRASNFYPRPPRGGRPPALFAGRNKGLNFYPRPPRGGRPIAKHGSPSKGDFYPRPPRGGRRPLSGPPGNLQHFYPRPPRGGRRGARREVWRQYIFLSPPSARRATTSTLWSSSCSRYFYPRPPRGGRPLQPCSPHGLDAISIPALREEGDKAAAAVRRCALISIHALREEGDLTAEDALGELADFYPRPPRGGRHECFKRRIKPNVFLSPPSARRATATHQWTTGDAPISIPALREEGDTRRHEIP